MRKATLPLKLRNKKDERDQANMHQQIKNPEKLKLLVLCGSRLAPTDFTFMLRCKSLIKLDLSDNELITIPEYFKMEQFVHLKLLFLHNNNFKNLEDIKPVFQCKRLIHITLHKNPIDSIQLEHFLINVLRFLKMVNQRVVFQEEREDSVVIGKTHVQVNIQAIGIDITQKREGEENLYIQRLERQLDQIDNLWTNFNPLVKFQRLWRARRLSLGARKVILQGCYESEEGQEEGCSLEQLRKYFQSWKAYKKGMKATTQLLVGEGKSHLTYNYKGYLLYQRNRKVNDIVSYFFQRIRRKVAQRKAVKVFAKHLTIKVLVFESASCFYNVSGLNESQRLIVSTHQLPILENLLHHCDRITLKDHPYQLSPCRDYICIRTMDSYRQEDQHNMYRHFLQPSMHCIFLKNKPITTIKAVSLSGIRQLDYIGKGYSILSESDRKKSKEMYQLVSKYIDNEYYKGLVEFRCQDPQYFKLLLRLIYYANTKAVKLEKISKSPSDLPLGFNFLNPFSDQLVIYLDKQLERTTAAVLIQKSWRRHSVYKSASAVIAQIRLVRAALLVQHFYRSLRFKHRVSFNIRMAKQLKHSEDSQVLIQQELYFGLGRIGISQQLCSGLTLLYNSKSVSLSSTMGKSPLFPNIREHFPQSQGGDMVRGDLYHILHTGALSVSKVCLNRRYYLKFSYESVAETKKRIVFLGLFSYTMKQKGTFVRVFRQLDLLQPWMQVYESTIGKVYGVNIVQSKVDSDTKKVICNSDPVFVFHDSDIAYFDKNRQPSQSWISLSLRIYSYHSQQHPLKLDELTSISFRYFKASVPIQQPQHKAPLQTASVAIMDNPMSSRRLTQKTKRMVQTLKELTSPLQITRNMTAKHMGEERQSMQKKREEVREARETSNHNRLVRTEYKKLEIRKVKKWHKKIKDEVQTSKIHLVEQQSQRKQKVQDRCLSNRDRRLSQQSRMEHESDFLQKGNFLFKQYIKVNIMRDKIDDLERKRFSVTGKLKGPRTLSETSRKYIQLGGISMDERLIQVQDRSESPLPKSTKSILETPRYEQYASTGMILANQSRTQQVLQKPRLRRTKQHMVHGVFPEEFYAIEKKPGYNLPLI